MACCMRCWGGERSIEHGAARDVEVAAFELPSPLPSWPDGGGFSKKKMDLGGGLEVREVTSFALVWTALEGGPDNGGAAFFRPSPLPTGFFQLGCYAQRGGGPLSGWVLAGTDAGNTAALRPPVDFTLLWSSEGSKLKRNGDGYFWLPRAPEGYSAVGLLITATREKPSPEEIRCVRSDLTEPSEAEGEIWSYKKDVKFSMQRPVVRGSRATGVAVGTFTALAATPPLSCLKNTSSLTSLMPNRTQIDALASAYPPLFCFHPKDSYLPSSIGWYFANGAVLRKKGDPQETLIDVVGSNLPQGSDDAEYWIDVPADGVAREKVLKGNLASAEAYLQVKPMLGGTCTDMAFWLFFPFNGPARAKLGLVTIDIKPIGQHVGDWEHVTVRVSNFSGAIRRVFFSQHSGGEWVDPSKLEFQQGNKPVVYVSLNGHAVYPAPGLVMQGTAAAGMRNDTAKGGATLDASAKWVLVAADHLENFVSPPWLDYRGQWGPSVTYWTDGTLKKVAGFLPSEVFGEEGPNGPKAKGSWEGDEKYKIVS